MPSGALTRTASLAAVAPAALAGVWELAGLRSGRVVNSQQVSRRKEKLQSHGAGKLRLLRN